MVKKEALKEGWLTRKKAHTAQKEAGVSYIWIQNKITIESRDLKEKHYTDDLYRI